MCPWSACGELAYTKYRCRLGPTSRPLALLDTSAMVLKRRCQVHTKLEYKTADFFLIKLRVTYKDHGDYKDHGNSEAQGDYKDQCDFKDQ